MLFVFRIELVGSRKVGNNLQGKSCRDVSRKIMKNLLDNNCYRLQKSNDMLVCQ